tara:strand:- start:517 stop:678 length:162 start_codon:yes stop_codon:yes gene_type:complete
MEALPLIILLLLSFSFILVFEIVKIKKQLRKVYRLTQVMKTDLKKLKDNNSIK